MVMTCLAFSISRITPSGKPPEGAEISSMISLSGSSSELPMVRMSKDVLAVPEAMVTDERAERMLELESTKLKSSPTTASPEVVDKLTTTSEENVGLMLTLEVNEDERLSLTAGSAASANPTMLPSFSGILIIKYSGLTLKEFSPAVKELCV